MPKINIIILCIFILFYSCQFSETNHSSVLTESSIFLVNYTKGWDINYSNVKNQEFSFLQKPGYQIYTGNIISFELSDSLYIKDFKLHHPIIKNSKQIIEFELYLNDQYAGKYNEKYRINFSCYINSFRIVILKTGTEKSFNAWDESFYYKFTRDSAINGITNLRLIFGLDSSFQKKIRMKKITAIPEVSKNSNALLKDERKAIKPFIINRIGKLNSDCYDQITSLDSNGFIQIYQKKSDRKLKKTVSELFFTGFIHLNPALAEEQNVFLKGNILYFKEDTVIKKKTLFTDYVSFSNNTLKSNLFDEPVYLDLPDNAMLDIRNIDSFFRIDIPYASENNVTGEKLYSCNKCFLRYKVIKSLLDVKKVLNKHGFGIRLFDCYRPLEVQKILFRKFPVKGYVADTVGGSIHNRGTAVDLSLTDLSGNDIDMGSEYDEFSVRSHISYNQMPDTIFKCRQFLRKTMIDNHFVPIRMEWWHFEFDEARKYRKLNDSFPCSRDW